MADSNEKKEYKIVYEAPPRNQNSEQIKGENVPYRTYSPNVQNISGKNPAVNNQGYYQAPPQQNFVQSPPVYSPQNNSQQYYQPMPLGVTPTNQPNPYNPYAYGNPQANSDDYKRFMYEHQLRVNGAKKKLRFLGNMAGLGLLLFIIANTMISLFLGIPSLYSLYKNSSAFQSAFSIIGSFLYVGVPFFIVSLFIKTRDKSTNMLPLKKANTKRVALCIPIGLSICLFANIITNIFITILSALGVSLSQQSAGSLSASNAPELILALLATAVMPGLMEEFAMRGVVLQPLRKFGMAFAIISTSVIFGIMHGNLIQAPFAIIVGLCFGFFAVKCNTLWVAIIIHMLNNAFSVIMEFVQNTVSKTAYTVSYYVSFGVIIAIGIACAIILLTTDKGFMSKGEGNVADESASLLTKGQKFVSFFINVPMILGVIYMIYCTSLYIKV